MDGLAYLIFIKFSRILVNHVQFYITFVYVFFYMQSYNIFVFYYDLFCDFFQLLRIEKMLKLTVCDELLKK